MDSFAEQRFLKKLLSHYISSYARIKLPWNFIDFPKNNMDSGNAILYAGFHL
jgi:hypothetical protein